MSRRIGVPNGEKKEHPPAVADAGRFTDLGENVHHKIRLIDDLGNSSTGQNVAALIRYRSLFPN
jgi:hypothetical protein